eukprot:g21184.t1
MLWSRIISSTCSRRSRNCRSIVKHPNSFSDTNTGPPPPTTNNFSSRVCRNQPRHPEDKFSVLFAQMFLFWVSEFYKNHTVSIPETKFSKSTEAPAKPDQGV